MHSVSKLKAVLKALFQTVMEITEEKPSFQIDKKVYCLLVLINIFQISGYIFCQRFSKLFIDEKFSTLAYINEVSTGTFLLLMKSDDRLTLICFILIQLLIYFYYAYIFILTYFKHMKPRIYSVNKKLFLAINQAMIIFFTLYYWIFLTPFTEISLGILSCNEFSFLSEYRNKNNCSSKPAIWNILGGVGVILSVITNFMILFFFRSYEFLDTNLLRRKFSSLQLPICLAFFLLQFFYYIEDFYPTVKFISAQAMGVFMIVDVVANFPYRNRIILSFYIMGTSYFWISHSLITIWNYSGKVSGDQLFYPLLFFISFIVFTLITVLNFQYEKMMRISPQTIKKLYQRIDFYVEEIMRLSIEGAKNEEFKFKLKEVILFHQGVCSNMHCICKNHSFFSSYNKEIQHSVILDLVDCIMKDYLQNQLILKNPSEKEHLFLKYITFQARFKNNPVKAYYQLKLFKHQQKNNLSSYFNVISEVLSNTFEQQIISSQKSNYMDKSSQYGHTISINAILETDSIKSKTIPLIANFISSKILFWNSLKKGFKTIDEFKVVATNFSRESQTLKKTFSYILGTFEFEQAQSKNAIMLKVNLLTLQQLFIFIFILLKIISIYKCLVLSQIVKSHQLQYQVSELKKKDSQKPYFIIHTENLFSGNVQPIQASLSKDKGRITNTLTQMHANFFGYQFQDIQTIKNIKQLMPPYISNIHDYLMNNYLERGHSILLEQSHPTFSVDRNGFLIPQSLRLSGIFGIQDDFRMNAVLSKQDSDKNCMLINSMGIILGITRPLLTSLFFLQCDQTQNDEVLIKLKNEMMNISVFLFLPKLIKILQSTSYQNQDQSFPSIKSFDQGTQNKQTDKNSKNSKQIFKEGKAAIKIPFSIYDIQQLFLKNQPDKYELHKMLSKQNEELLNNSLHSEIDYLYEYEDFINENIDEWDYVNLVSSLETVMSVYEDTLFYSKPLKNTYKKCEAADIIYRIEFSELSKSVPDRHASMSALQNQFKTISQNNSQTFAVSNGTTIFGGSSLSQSRLTIKGLKSIIIAQPRSQQSFQNHEINIKEKENNQILVSKQSSHKNKLQLNNILNASQELVIGHRSSIFTQPIHQTFPAVEGDDSISLITNKHNLVSPFHDREKNNLLQSQVLILSENTKLLDFHSGEGDSNLFPQTSEQGCKVELNKQIENQSFNTSVHQKKLLIHDVLDRNSSYQNAAAAAYFSFSKDRISLQQENSKQVDQSDVSQSSHRLEDSTDSQTLNNLLINKQSHSILTRMLLNLATQQKSLLLNSQNGKRDIQRTENYFESENEGNSFIKTNMKKESILQKKEKQFDLKSSFKKGAKNFKQQSDHSMSSSLKNLDNSLLNEIMNKNQISSSKFITILLCNHTIFQQYLFQGQILYQLGLLLLSFGVQSFIFVNNITNFHTTLQQILTSQNQFSELSLIYSNQTSTTLTIYEYSKDLLDGIDLTKMISICTANYHAYYQSLNLNFNFIEISGRQIIRDLAVYTPGQKDMIKAKLVETYFLNSFIMQNVCKESNPPKEQSGLGLMYLLENFILNRDTSNMIVKEQFDYAQNILTKLQEFFFKFMIVVITSFSLTTFLSFPILKKISNYKEKILLLISRINHTECEAELFKLDKCLTLLKSTHDDWLHFDFVDFIVNYAKYKLQDRDLKEHREMSQHKYPIHKNSQQICHHKTESNKESKREVESSRVKLNKTDNSGDGETEKTYPLKKSFKDKTENSSFTIKIDEDKRDKNQIIQNIRKIMTVNNAKNKYLKFSKRFKKQKNHQQQFSSLILNQSLTLWKSFIVVFTLFLIGVAFFIIVIILSFLKSQNIYQPLSLYQHSTLALSSLSSVINLSEIIPKRTILSPAFAQQMAIFTPSCMTKLIQTYQSELQQLISFVSLLSSGISDVSIFSDSQQQYISNLFSSDLCLLFPNDYVCIADYKDNHLRGVLYQGLVAVLTLYKSMYNQFQELFQNDVPIIQSELLQYTSEFEYSYCILNGFDTPASALHEITSFLNSVIISTSDNLMQLVSYYFLLGGIIVGSIWIILCIKIKNRIDSDLSEISFSLTCIPYEKSIEDATIHMLKSIKKM